MKMLVITAQEIHPVSDFFSNAYGIHTCWDELLGNYSQYLPGSLETTISLTNYNSNKSRWPANREQFSKWSLLTPFCINNNPEKKRRKISSLSTDNWYYFCPGQSKGWLHFGSVDQAYGSIRSDVKDQELVPHATCYNQQKNISAIPSISRRVFPFEISYIKIQSPKVFQVVLRNFQETCWVKEAILFTGQHAVRETTRTDRGKLPVVNKLKLEI